MSDAWMFQAMRINYESIFIAQLMSRQLRMSPRRAYNTNLFKLRCMRSNQLVPARTLHSFTEQSYLSDLDENLIDECGCSPSDGRVERTSSNFGRLQISSLACVAAPSSEDCSQGSAPAPSPLLPHVRRQWAKTFERFRVAFLLTAPKSSIPC